MSLESEKRLAVRDARHTHAKAKNYNFFPWLGLLQRTKSESQRTTKPTKYLDLRSGKATR